MYGRGGGLNIYVYSPLFSVQYNKYWLGIMKRTLYLSLYIKIKNIVWGLNN